MRNRAFTPGVGPRLAVLLAWVVTGASLEGQSQPTSISFSPGTVQQGECYTIRAGNAANMTLDGTVKLSGILGFWRRNRSSVERRINNLGTCQGAD